VKTPFRAKRLLFSTLFVAALFCSQAQSQARIPAPEGWIGLTPSTGRLAAIKHPATLGVAEAALVRVTSAETASYRAGLISLLEKAGARLTSKESTGVGSSQGLKITMRQELDGRPFEIVIIEVEHTKGLIYVTAVLRPDDENSLESLEKGLMTFAAAALASQG
jgi:hypothetical protein